MTLKGIATSDFQGLQDLKVKARANAKDALPEVAKQFEGIFLQSMLKSMRMGQHFLDESSAFRGKNEATFQDMLDGQYSTDIANSRGIGLAAMLTKQLESNVGTSQDSKMTTQDLKPLPLAKMDNNAELIPPVKHISQDSVAGSKENTNIDEFVKSLWPKAQQAASALGLDPKVLMAQAALETGWGKFVAKDSEGNTSNNLFNIKSGSNKELDSIAVNTTEYIANTPIKTTASFRKYSSIEDSINDYVSLISNNSRYQTALANAANPELYVNELGKAGYATDPKYGTKILSIYHGDELNQAMQRCGFSDPI